MEKKKKPKVMHVLKSSIYSGAENVVITIMKNLKDDYEFLYLATDGTIREKLEQEQIPYLLLERFSRGNLKRAIQEWKPDIVHAHDFSATVLCAMVPGRFRLISHLHYDPPWARAWNMKTFCYRMAGCRIYKILTVSKKSYQNLIFANNLEKKCMVIGNPVDIKLIRGRGEEPGSYRNYDLIFAGRFVEQKNPKRYLEIVKELRDNGVSAASAMLGSGELEEDCRKMIREYQLENQVDMLGFVSNPYPYIKRARLLCMTSEWEGYGLVLLEANILGVPVLSSRTAGAEDVLGEDAPELCRNTKEFVEKIQRLMEDEEEYKKWKQQSERRVTKIMTIDDYMRSIDAIYQAGLRGRKN